MLLLLVAIIVIVLLMVFIPKPIVEKQTGALLQLYAKGPQDTYLTDDAWKHMWWYTPYYRYPSLWQGWKWPSYRYVGKYPYYGQRLWW